MRKLEIIEKNSKIIIKNEESEIEYDGKYDNNIDERVLKVIKNYFINGGIIKRI